MLVFIIPLKSKKVSKSWEYTSKLFERCIKSICNQTSQDFQAIVICHEKPDIQFSHPRILYVQVDFAPPRLSDGDGPMLIDRTQKVMKGLYLSRQFKPSHVMVADADDCVSQKLAEFVSKNTQCNGWYVDKGYRYTDGSKRILPTKQLHRLCGTSIILKYDLYELPMNLEDSGDESIGQYHINHNEAVRIMAQQGTPLEPLPFEAAIYISPINRDNLFATITFSRKLRQNPKWVLSPIKLALQKILQSQPLTESIRKEFTLETIQ